MGIAAVYTPRSKYKVYWSMVLAEPDKRRVVSNRLGGSPVLPVVRR
jgi:hypothetical protein